MGGRTEELKVLEADELTHEVLLGTDMSELWDLGKWLLHTELINLESTHSRPEQVGILNCRPMVRKVRLRRAMRRMTAMTRSHGNKSLMTDQILPQQPRHLIRNQRREL